MPRNNGQKPSASGIRITEVGPRDGLQNEPDIVPTEVKVAFVDALSQTGVTEIEAGSFVSPQAVPQLADSDEVFRRIKRRPNVVFSALVPNERGLERARAARVDKIALFTAVSETFNRRNVNCTIRESIERFKPVVSRAKRDGIIVRGYVSTVTHCPFEGPVRPSFVVEVARQLLDLGVDEISLGETIGKAVPGDVRKLLDEVMRQIASTALSLHFHDTYGLAIANVLTAWMEYGIEAFDTSAGGLGGCPFAPGASGNVATEDVLYALQASGARVNADGRLVVAAARQMEGVLHHPLSSRLSRVRRTQASYEPVP